MMASSRTSATSSAVISGSGLAKAKMIGFAAIDFIMAGVNAAFDREPEDHIGAGECLGQRARLGLDRISRFPLVHALGAALVDHALGVAQD